MISYIQYTNLPIIYTSTCLHALMHWPPWLFGPTGTSLGDAHCFGCHQHHAIAGSRIVKFVPHGVSSWKLDRCYELFLLVETPVSTLLVSNVFKHLSLDRRACNKKNYFGFVMMKFHANLMPLRYCLAVCLKRKHSVRLGVTHLLVSHPFSSIFQVATSVKMPSLRFGMVLQKANGSLALSFSTSYYITETKKILVEAKVISFTSLQTNTKHMKNQSQQQKLSTFK